MIHNLADVTTDDLQISRSLRVAFPCNQFGGQEPGTSEEIAQLVCARFKAKYPILHKVNLNLCAQTFL
jgi:glutathione peroxidase-family protein